MVWFVESTRGDPTAVRRAARKVGRGTLGTLFAGTLGTPPTVTEHSAWAGAGLGSHCPEPSESHDDTMMEDTRLPVPQFPHQ